ncbi:MAG: FAD binding domain-containing protein [Geminicoccaceae bacterium]
MNGTGDFARPSTLDAALVLMAEGGWKPVAGATDIYPAHVTKPLAGRWLDLSALEELRGVVLTGDGLRIGALATWANIEAAGLPPAFRALRQAASRIGGRQIQNVATVCGNIVNASPAADGAPPLLVFDAEVELRSASSKRLVPLAGFLLGNRKTALAAGELVTALHIPVPPQGSRSTFLKLGARSHLVISITMVALRLSADPGDGSVGPCAIAVGACAPTARRLPALEKRRSLQRSELASLRVSRKTCDHCTYRRHTGNGRLSPRSNRALDRTCLHAVPRRGIAMKSPEHQR